MWQSEMVHLGFDSAVANSQELVEFCERLEFDEDLNQKPEAMPKPGPTGGKTGRLYALPKSFRGGEVPTIHLNTVPCMASMVMIEHL